jgi:hypothetical protein
MQKHRIYVSAFAMAAQLFLSVAGSTVLAQTAKSAYPAMAPLNQFMIASEQAEIALARSAAPSSISDNAQIMVLKRDGYRTVVHGKNGFLCLVERSWAQGTDQAEFWNPKMRAPHCFNPQAARSFAPIYLMKTRLVLAGTPKSGIAREVAAALDTGKLPALEPGAMAYMMSRQQYLNDQDKDWHPHIMFYFSGDQAKNWAPNTPNPPFLAVNDPEEHVTILMVLADHWSDGTKAPTK